MRYSRYLLAVVLLGSVVGCQYALPPGYVKVEPGFEYRFRAVSADGSAIALRTEENPENGDLAFWEKAVKSRLVDVRGYKLADRKEASCRGVKGAEMTFDYERKGVAYCYVMMLFVEARRVHSIEIAGLKQKIEPELPAIKEAIGKWSL